MPSLEQVACSLEVKPRSIRIWSGYRFRLVPIQAESNPMERITQRSSCGDISSIQRPLCCDVTDTVDQRVSSVVRISKIYDRMMPYRV